MRLKNRILDNLNSQKQSRLRRNGEFREINISKEFLSLEKERWNASVFSWLCDNNSPREKRPPNRSKCHYNFFLCKIGIFCAPPTFKHFLVYILNAYTLLRFMIFDILAIWRHIGHLVYCRNATPINLFFSFCACTNDKRRKRNIKSFIHLFRSGVAHKKRQTPTTKKQIYERND